MKKMHFKDRLSWCDGESMTPYINILSLNVRQGQRGNDTTVGPSSSSKSTRIQFVTLFLNARANRGKRTDYGGQNPAPEMNELFGLKTRSSIMVSPNLTIAAGPEVQESGMVLE